MDGANAGKAAVAMEEGGKETGWRELREEFCRRCVRCRGLEEAVGVKAGGGAGVLGFSRHEGA